MSNPSDSLMADLRYKICLKLGYDDGVKGTQHCIITEKNFEDIIALIKAHSLQERNQLIGEVEAQTVKLWNKYGEPPLIDGHEILGYLYELREQLETTKEAFPKQRDMTPEQEKPFENIKELL